MPRERSARRQDEWSRQARVAGVRALEFVPPAYCAVMRRRHPEWRVVDKTADLVIEGYQSSGNTFARMAAEHSNPGIDVASHVHSWAHVAQGRLFGKAVIVLLRAPEDAVSSHLVRMELDDPAIELRRYLTFCQGIRRLRKQVVLAPFEIVTRRFGDVIVAVNSRYGTSFEPFDHHDVTATEAIFEQMEHEMASIGASWRVARPRAERKEATEALRRRLRVEHAPALARCQAGYRDLLTTALR